jgi:uncharacterized membrane protein YdjX (TVP38/TMEM64 family)
VDQDSAGKGRLLGRVLTLLVVGAVLVGAQYLREQIGIELSASSIQQAVGEFGAFVSIAYIVLVIFRQSLLLPSALLLTTAGVLFGAPLGTLLGAVGVTLNATVLFTGARYLGRDWVLPRIQARYPRFEQHATSAGPWVIALITGHPMGPLTPFHFAAGVTPISYRKFLIAVGPAAVVRAGCYSFLGANLLDSGSPRFWIASGVLVVVALLPLAHPGLRARILRAVSGSENREDVDSIEQTPL